MALSRCYFRRFFYGLFLLVTMTHSDSYIQKKEELKKNLIEFMQDKPLCKMQDFRESGIIKNRKYLIAYLDELISENKIWFNEELGKYGLVKIPVKISLWYFSELIPIALEKKFKSFKEICPDGKTIQNIDCQKTSEINDISLKSVLEKLYCYSKLRKSILQAEIENIKSSNDSKLAIDWYNKVYQNILTDIFEHLKYIQENTGSVLLSRLSRLTIQYADLLWNDDLYMHNYKSGAYTFSDILKILDVYLKDGIKDASAIHLILSNTSRKRGTKITNKEIQESRQSLTTKFPKHLRKTKDLLSRILDSNGQIDHDNFVRMYLAYVGKPLADISGNEMKLVYKLVDNDTVETIKTLQIPVKEGELVNLPSYDTSPFF